MEEESWRGEKERKKEEMAGAMACSCKIETDLGDARNGQNPHLWVNTGFRRPLRLSFRGCGRGCFSPRRIEIWSERATGKKIEEK